MSTPLARRSTERQDLRSDNAKREFEDETKECDELRAAFSVSKKERGRTCASITATNMKKNRSHDRFRILDKFESYPTKKRPVSGTTYVPATGKHARDIVKRGSEIRSSR